MKSEGARVRQLEEQIMDEIIIQIIMRYPKKKNYRLNETDKNLFCCFFFFPKIAWSQILKVGIEEASCYG